MPECKRDCLNVSWETFWGSPVFMWAETNKKGWKHDKIRFVQKRGGHCSEDIGTSSRKLKIKYPLRESGKEKDHMKKLWRTLGAVSLGAIFLTGCREQADEGLEIQPVAIDGAGAESRGQKDREQTGQGQAILTLGTCEAPWELTNAVDAYNARNGKYRVEIVNYLQEDQDYPAAQERLKLDLATSKGTDIIWLGDMAADELGYSGVLADLNPFLTPKDREHYLVNILEDAQTGDALYEIAAAFTLSFLAGDSRKLGTETGWIMEEMLAAFRADGKDANSLGNVGVNTAQELVRNAIEDFIDWNTGKADFCNQEFYDILEFCRDESGWAKATNESVASGTHLAVLGGISGVSSIQYMDWLFGDDWTAKGWPCRQGTGVKVSFWNSFAISSYSQCPEGAWDFLTYYITLDWLEDYTALHPDLPSRTYANIHGLPLNRSSFEEMLEWSVVQRYYDDTGEPVPFYFGEEPVPDFYANSAEDLEKIREIISLADGKVLSNQSAVFQIIGEEVSGYKTGVLSAEKTAEKIQNRVQLYLDELRP